MSKKELYILHRFLATIWRRCSVNRYSDCSGSEKVGARIGIHSDGLVNQNPLGQPLGHDDSIRVNDFFQFCAVAVHTKSYSVSCEQRQIS